MTTESLRKFHAIFLTPKISYNSHQMHDEATPSHIKYIPTTKYQTSDCMASLGKFRGKDNKEFLQLSMHNHKYVEVLSLIKYSLKINWSEFLTYSKISHFNVPLGCQKNILGLQVSMQDFSIMDVLESETYLNKPV